MSATMLRLLGLGLLVSIGCAQNRGCERASDRYDRRLLADALEAEAEAEQARDTLAPGLVLGEFPLAKDAIVDGDTIKVGGLDSSLRLLTIDTEETFKGKKELALFDRLGFEGYLAAKAEKTDRPVKCPTPMGMEAKKWAIDFFEGVSRVRLERDHPKELRGRYGRLLAYVFVEKDGEWVNYNVECVRAGMSPYFSKYGYSRRFHDEFVAAQEEARQAQRGIWNPETQHYPDYDVRLAWWNNRADFIARFEAEAADRDDFVVLTHWDALDRLAALEGEEVEILGGVGEIRQREGNRPTRALLSRRMFADFPLIFFDDEVFARSRIQDAAGEFVRVRGTVTTYEYKSRRRSGEDREQLQMVVKVPQQVKTSATAPGVRKPDLSKGVPGGVVGGVVGGTLGASPNADQTVPPRSADTDPAPSDEPPPESVEPVGPPATDGTHTLEPAPPREDPP